MSCCIHICPCLNNVCVDQANTAALRAGYKPCLNQVCLSPEYQAIVAAGGTGACVCPNLTPPSNNPLSLSGPVTALITQGFKDAGTYVYDVAVNAVDTIKKDFNKLPGFTTILIALFFMLAILVFVYGYAKSR